MGLASMIGITWLTTDQSAQKRQHKINMQNLTEKKQLHEKEQIPFFAKIIESSETINLERKFENKASQTQQGKHVEDGTSYVI